MDLNTATANPSTEAESAEASPPEPAYALAEFEPDAHPALEGPHAPPPAALNPPVAGGPLPPETPAPAQAPAAPKSLNLKRKRRARAKAAHVIPAWAASLLVHVLVLGSLAAFTLSSAPRKIIANINSALVESTGPKEELPIYADPTAAGRSQEAVGVEQAPLGGSAGASGGGFGGIGTGPPSATPTVSGVGNGVGEDTGLPGINLAIRTSGISLTPARPNLDLSGGGGITGDIFDTKGGAEEALDQIAREILRHLAKSKLTVVWLFDESGSMKDDQRTIRAKFDRVATELKVNLADNKKAAGALNHLIVGFGEGLHFLMKKPTLNIDEIGAAIDKIPVDETGTENTMKALATVANECAGWINKERKVMMVLVTDESGDDGGYLEEAYQSVVGRGITLYVIGRQSLFGYDRMHLKYVDPVTKDVYWPAIRRGPETADIELLQWDGLHGRNEEQPSGFAPYELARLTKASGGIYFQLPTEEGQRARQRERAYSMVEMKEYMPDYVNRMAYVAAREKSPFRTRLRQIIERTKDYGYPTHFPIAPNEMVPKAMEAGGKAAERLEDLLAIEKELEQIRPLRDREPSKRWQAHYDLIRAQIVVYQIKSYEYRACLEEMVKNLPMPSRPPGPGEVIEWDLVHSKQRKAAKDQTEKKYRQAESLLNEVIAMHPKTPWADLAQDELNRGFGVFRGEWRHNKEFNDRAKLVPKF
ncbi:MAG: vWA domain-containing protein [Isosphaeraceae bacterium]